MKSIFRYLCVLTWLLGVVCLCGSWSATTTTPAPAAIKWISIEEAYRLQQQQPKKILVDIYASWCGWCKRMDNTTFVDPEVVQYINDNFYAVKFDAETKRTIQLGGEQFAYRSNGKGGMNELAMELAGNQLSLPTVVLLDEQLNNRLVAQGYQSNTDLNTILHYYASGSYHKGVTWEQYKRSYLPQP